MVTASYAKRCHAKKMRFKEHYTAIKENKRANLNRYFERLLEGISVQDLNFVLNIDSLAHNVRMYDGDLQELHPVCGHATVAGEILLGEVSPQARL